jgi:hypothetical protein
MAATLDVFRTEKAAGERTFLRHDKQLADHDKRIDTLEIKVGIKE